MAKNFLLASKKANYKTGGAKKAGSEENLLVKMTKGGMMDMTDMVTAKYGMQTKKMGMMKKGGYKNY